MVEKPMESNEPHPHARESSPSVTKIAQEFVRQYYTMLATSPKFVHRFYSTESVFIRDGAEPVVGQVNIQKEISDYGYSEHSIVAKIRHVDACMTRHDGIVIQVVGDITVKDVPRRFMQTFVLAPQSTKKYFVFNDIQRFIDVDEPNAVTQPNVTQLNDERPVEDGQNGGATVNGAATVEDVVGRGQSASPVVSPEPSPIAQNTPTPEFEPSAPLPQRPPKETSQPPPTTAWGQPPPSQLAYNKPAENNIGHAETENGAYVDAESAGPQQTQSPPIVQQVAEVERKPAGPLSWADRVKPTPQYQPPPPIVAQQLQPQQPPPPAADIAAAPEAPGQREVNAHAAEDGGQVSAAVDENKNCELFIVNFPESCTPESLKAEFMAYGNVIGTRITQPSSGSRSHGGGSRIGFVTFDSPDGPHIAMKASQEASQGRRCLVLKNVKLAKGQPPATVNIEFKSDNRRNNRNYRQSGEHDDKGHTGGRGGIFRQGGGRGMRGGGRGGDRGGRGPRSGSYNAGGGGANFGRG